MTVAEYGMTYVPTQASIRTMNYPRSRSLSDTDEVGTSKHLDDIIIYIRWFRFILIKKGKRQAEGSEQQV